MLQNDSHLNCLCVMARLIEALAIYVPYIWNLRSSWGDNMKVAILYTQEDKWEVIGSEKYNRWDTYDTQYDRESNCI